MLYDDVIADSRAFPECWQDARYGGSVCNSSLRFVTVGMTRASNPNPNPNPNPSPNPNQA